ncbi:MAG: RDD family protein [Euryarchaeota archaeon]|nr:RDD family protein [Euryarchaeota archaeon]
MKYLWLKRLASLIIDAVILTALMWLISALIYPLIIVTNSFILFRYWLLLAGLIIIVYFTYLEGKYATTVGKSVLKIKVTALEGKMGYKKAFIRNLSKIYWFPLIVDFLVGIFAAGPDQRTMDRIAKTLVVNVEELKDEE